MRLADHQERRSESWPVVAKTERIGKRLARSEQFEVIDEERAFPAVRLHGPPRTEVRPTAPERRSLSSMRQAEGRIRSACSVARLCNAEKRSGSLRQTTRHCRPSFMPGFYELWARAGDEGRICRSRLGVSGNAAQARRQPSKSISKPDALNENGQRDRSESRHNDFAAFGHAFRKSKYQGQSKRASQSSPEKRLSSRSASEAGACPEHERPPTGESLCARPGSGAK